MSDKVLIVDDDRRLVDLIELHLGEAGIPILRAETGAAALRRLEEDPPAAVVLDLGLPDVTGHELLEKVRAAYPDLPVVMLTAQGAVEEVVACMRLGAVDYVQKPFDATRLVTSVRNARTQGTLRAKVESLTRELRRGEGFATMIGRSPALRKAIDLLQRAARKDVTVLLDGESGTGKEVAARAIHAESDRRAGPFVAVNCGAIPEALIESELFGHEKGSFTGAAATRVGRFEQAQGGTIFLDEIGELRTDLQVRLLRVLQERSVQRLGGTAARPIDVRVIAATHKDLRAEVARHAFREDLYYRLAVFPVRLPPLRDREGDLLLLADAFSERFAARHSLRLRGFTPDARRALQAYPWPGNVRELENAVERATILEDGPAISLLSLPDEVVCAAESAGIARPATPPAQEAPAEPAPASPPAREAGGQAPEGAAAVATATGPDRDIAAPRAGDPVVPLEEVERRLILHALEATGWNRDEAALRLGIGRATIYRKIERLGLAPAAARA